VLPPRKLGNKERRSTEDGRFLQGSLRHESRASKDEAGGDLFQLRVHRRDRPKVAQPRGIWSASGSAFGKRGFHGLQDRSRCHSSPARTPSKIEANVLEAQENTDGRKEFPGTCGRRRAWSFPLTRSDTSCGAWGTPAGEETERRSIRPPPLEGGNAVCLGPSGCKGRLG